MPSALTNKSRQQIREQRILVSARGSYPSFPAQDAMNPMILDENNLRKRQAQSHEDLRLPAELAVLENLAHSL